MKSKWILFVSTLFISLLLFAGVIELKGRQEYKTWKASFDDQGWLHLITIPSPNPIRLWEYRPNSQKGRIRINQHGFRDKPTLTQEKSEKSKRVAFLGDSITLGMGLDEEDIFLRVWERNINRNKKSPQWEALNFSIDGYNTIQLYELLKDKVLDFNPDHLVYVMCLNDFDFNVASGQKIRYFKKPKSFFGEWLEKRYLRFKKPDYHLYHFRKNRKIIFDHILKMKKRADQNGIQFTVLISPVFYEGHESWQSYPLTDMHNKIKAFLRENQIHHFDLLDIFSKFPGPPDQFSKDGWHPNKQGHTFIAGALNALFSPQP